MIDSSLLSGVGLGALLGYLAWAMARWFIRRYAAGGVAPRPGVGQSSGRIAVSGMAMLGGYVFWRVDEPKIIIAVMISTALLMTIVLVDYAVHRIPNELVMALLVWGPAQVVWLGYPSLWAALFGALVGGGLLLAVTWIGRGALGLGDVKFMAAEGTLLGFPLILHGLLLGVVFGGVAAALLLMTRRAGRKDAFAYGPYLALGGWLIYLMTLNLLPWQPCF